MVSASLPELLTVREVAELLRLKERKIYDLLSNKQIPCTRVAGKWLFPKPQIQAWLAENSDYLVDVKLAQHHPNVLLGGHDPLIEWVLAELNHPFSTSFNGSQEGLNAFAAGEGVVTGTHLLDVETAEYNTPMVSDLLQQEDVVMLEWAKREQGIVVAKGNPLGIKDVTDLEASKARFIERQPGAGSQTLFIQLLETAGIESKKLKLLPNKAFNHHEVGFAVSSDEADAGIAVRSVAQQMRLDFIPLTWERFDLVIRRRDYFEPNFQQLLGFTHTNLFKEKAAAMGGYDISELGKVRWNA